MLQSQLGPDPIKQLVLVTGERGFQFLLFSLAISPLARLYTAPLLLQWRRPAGLWAFYFLSLHLLVFFQGYIGWSWTILIEELKERPYVLVGFSAWLSLLPLALTSTDSARRRLGRRWRQLHRLIYPATLLAWLHLLWLARSDVGEAVVYGLIFAVLLGWRLRRYRQRAR